MNDDTGGEPKIGRLVLAAMLASQVLLAMTVDQALVRIWSRTTSLFNLAFPLTLCALMAYFSMLAEVYRNGNSIVVWRDLLWLLIFWFLALLTTRSGGGLSKIQAWRCAQ